MTTGATVGSLGLVAYNAPSKQFLDLGGPLAVALGLLCGAGLISAFNPASALLTNAYLYGGVGVFGLFVLYDTQKIIEDAKEKAQFDPIRGALDIYLDAINLFIKFLEIYARSSSKDRSSSDD